MSLNLLGEGFDIHGGGSDLTFPHHENERVECEAAGYSFARYWMHSGMLNVSGEKMSKSWGIFSDIGRCYGPIWRTTFAPCDVTSPLPFTYGTV